jgi:ferric-dicitrate binding protein FerR (iron transport regulator)
MDLERHAAREQASQWLAKIERGLRLDEGPALRKWLQPTAHRTAILEVARQRASPDVMALLSELIPITLTPGPQAPPRGPTGVLISGARGEASFTVAHDADRPFLVRAGRHRLQATGTRFDVRVVNPETVELIVAEGQVTVLYSARDAPDTPAYLRLSNNMTSEDTPIDALAIAEVEPGLHFVHKIDPTDMDAVLARNYHLPAGRVSGGRILLKNGST